MCCTVDIDVVIQCVYDIHTTNMRMHNCPRIPNDITLVCAEFAIISGPTLYCYRTRIRTSVRLEIEGKDFFFLLLVAIVFLGGNSIFGSRRWQAINGCDDGTVMTVTN